MNDSVRLTLNSRDMNTIMLALMWMREDPDSEAYAQSQWDAMRALEAKVQAARRRMHGGGAWWTLQGHKAEQPAAQAAADSDKGAA